MKDNNRFISTIAYKEKLNFNRINASKKLYLATKILHVVYYFLLFIDTVNRYRSFDRSMRNVSKE